MVDSLQQTKGYVMGKMKEIAISIEAMVENYIDESRGYITVHVKDLVNFELNKLGLSMSQEEIQDMVETAIDNIYGI